LRNTFLALCLFLSITKHTSRGTLCAALTQSGKQTGAGDPGQRLNPQEKIAQGGNILSSSDMMKLHHGDLSSQTSHTNIMCYFTLGNFKTTSSARLTTQNESTANKQDSTSI